MDTSQFCVANNNSTTLAKIDPIVFAPNYLAYNMQSRAVNNEEITNKEKYWQGITPNPNHPFHILGSYLRSGAESIIEGIYSLKEYVPSFSIFKEMTVDDVLRKSSSEDMKRYCDYNEIFKNQAQEKLESLIIENQPGDEESLLHIKILLEAGVRTNQSLYSTTIKNRNIKLVALLHSYNINIDKNDYNQILNYLVSCTPEDEIQFQCNDIKNFIKKITQETTSSDEYEKIEKQIKDNYQTLLFKIEEAVNLAEKYNKPLLLLIGEAHHSLSGSFVNELILLDIISQKISVNTIHTEDPVNLFKLTYFGSINYSVGNLVEEQIFQLGMKKKFIDLFRFNETEMAEYKKACQNFNSTACSELESKYLNNEYSMITRGNMNSREQTMAQVILESSKEHSVAIVGGHHIKGLIENTNLSDHYHIMVINTAPFSNLICEDNDYVHLCLADDFLKKEEILSLPEVTALNEDAGVFIAPDILIEKTKAIHYDYSRDKTDKKSNMQQNSKVTYPELCQDPKKSLRKRS